MRLDISLMRGFGREMLLDHEVRFRESLVHIAVSRFMVTHHVRVHPLRHGTVRRIRADHRSALFHRSVHIRHMRKNFILDLNQPRGVPRGERGGGGDGGDRVPVVERFFAGHDVLEHVQVLARKSRREIRPGDNRLDLMHRFGPGGVYAENPRMGVRASHNGAEQHSRRGGVGTVFRAPGNLIESVRTIGPRPYNLESCYPGVIQSHHGISLISSAASITA